MGSSECIITVDEPWRVIPDQTSLVQMGKYTRNHTFYNIAFTGKQRNSPNPAYNATCLFGLYGGVHGFVALNCSGSYVRQGISIISTQKTADLVNTCSFNIFKNCTISQPRWGQRFGGLPADNSYLNSVAGLLANLCARNTFLNSVISDLVYVLLRNANSFGVPLINLLTLSKQVATVGLNDFSPTFVGDPTYPPVPPYRGR